MEIKVSGDMYEDKEVLSSIINSVDVQTTVLEVTDLIRSRLIDCEIGLDEYEFLEEIMEILCSLGDGCV